MTEEDFKRKTRYLVEKYIPDNDKKNRILSDIETYGSKAAKGIMRDITEYSGNIEKEDSKIIKDIAFNFI